MEKAFGKLKGRDIKTMTDSYKQSIWSISRNL